MKHYGPEPPWRGRSFNFGSWRWVPPSPDSWFDEPGYWEWFAPPAPLAGHMGEILQSIYLPPLMESLNAPFLAGLMAEDISHPMVFEVAP